MPPSPWKIVRWSLSSLAVVLLVAAVWMGYQAWKVNSGLRTAADAAVDLRAAATAGDDEAVASALARFEEGSSSAADTTGGVTWGLMARLPVVGDDADGVRKVSTVLADLAEDGIPPLSSTAQDLESLAPRSGRVDVDRVVALGPVVSDGLRAFADAERELDAHDPRDFVGPLAEKYVELSDQVSEVVIALDAADTALEVLPAMLGSEGPRSHVLVFQSNAEIRGGGGLVGATALVTATDGRIDLARQASGGSFEILDAPAVPFVGAEEAIYGEVLGRFFVNATMTPDFSRTAAIVKARWEQRFPETVDDVLSIDPVALSYLLEATGPVVVDGVSLDSTNAADELLHGVYLRFEDPARQDVFFQRATKAIFERVTDGVTQPETFLRGLSRGVQEGRIRVHSFDAAEQEVLAPTAISGVTNYDPGLEDPQVAFVLNDLAADKMSYFLRYDVSVDATACRDGVQRLTGDAQLLSDAPEDVGGLPDYVTGGGQSGTEPGSQLVLARIYGPIGGTITDIEFSSRKLDEVEIDDDRGRPVVTLVAALEPGQKVDIAWRMTTGPDQPGDVDVMVTPSTEPLRTSSTAVSAC